MNDLVVDPERMVAYITDSGNGVEGVIASRRCQFTTHKLPDSS